MATVNPLLQQIDAIAKEKGVEPEIIISAVQDALEAAARKRYKNEALRARFNQETGQLELYAVKRIVDPEARAVVLDAEHRPLLLLLRLHGEPDAGFRPLGGELPGVAQQVGEGDPRQPPVAVAGGRGRSLVGDAALRVGVAQAVHDFRRQGGEVDRLALQLRTVDVGEIEHVLHDAHHAGRFALDRVEVAAGLAVQRVGVLVLQDAAEARDVGQRRPQVVRDGVAEGAQLLVGFLQVHGVRRHLQVQRLHLLLPLAQFLVGLQRLLVGGEQQVQDLLALGADQVLAAGQADLDAELQLAVRAQLAVGEQVVEPGEQRPRVEGLADETPSSQGAEADGFGFRTVSRTEGEGDMAQGGVRLQGQEQARK